MATSGASSGTHGRRGLHRAATAFARFVSSRQAAVPPEDLVREAMPAARARSVSEASLLFLAGFVLDDLRTLRFPGWLGGSLLAALALSLGSSLHARVLAGRMVRLPREQARRRLTWARRLHRVLAVLSLLLFAFWLVMTSGGVNPFLA